MILVEMSFSCAVLETFKLGPCFFREVLPWSWINQERKLFFAEITMLFIRNALLDLIPYAQIKKSEKHPWRILTISKVAS